MVYVDNKKLIMGLFQSYTTAFKAEHIKIKHTGIYYTAFVLGIIMPLLAFTIMLITDDQNPMDTTPTNLFESFIKLFLPGFGGFFYPLAIIIAASRIAQLDHRNGGWQLMETQPVSKMSIFLSKFSVLLLHNFICIVSLIFSSLLLTWISSYFIVLPQGGFMEIPWSFCLRIMFRLFVSGLYLTALMYVLSVLLPSFIWSIIIGFLAMITTLFLTGFKIEKAWNPFTVLQRTGDNPMGSQVGNIILFTEWFGLLCLLLLLCFGYNWYSQKSFVRAFVKGKRFIAAAIITIVGTGLIYFMLKPLQFQPHKRTVLLAKIDSDQTFSNAHFVDRFTGDTISSAVVARGKFAMEFTENLPLDQYQLELEGGSSNAIPVVMSSHDSIFIDISSYNNKLVTTFGGTRLAENQTQLTGGPAWSTSFYLIENNSEYLEQPESIASQINDDWKDALSKSKNFTTPDNYIPKTDFADLDHKLIHLQFMNLWNSYTEKRRAAIPAASADKLPSEIAEIKKNISLKDESLLNAAPYLDYLMFELTKTDKRDIDQNAKRLDAIKKLSAGVFKDKLLFYQLKNNLALASNSTERAALMAGYSNDISNVKLRSLSQRFFAAQERIGKGRPAPGLNASSIEGKAVSFEALRGKYVLVDVWATWCGPCRTQSPHFERMAIKYKKDIVFVALSVDEQKQKWYLQAKNKSKSVLQWHAGTGKKFMTDYSIEGIPRFMFIDPDGNFISSEMPFPSENSFEDMIENELAKIKNIK
jgi:thiol-disulfide isomerase/thioredoxin